MHSESKVLSALLASCQKGNSEFGEIPHLTIPKEFTVQSLETLMPNPSRIKCIFMAHDVDSLIKYSKRYFDPEQTVAFANDEEGQFTVVFDYHSKAKPGWSDHMAFYNGPTERIEAEISKALPDIPIFYGNIVADFFQSTITITE